MDVVDDYAHHPTEIRATLAAARTAFPGRRIVAAFQPHLFSRTRDFAREFGEALAAADAVYIADIYPAREQPIPGVTADIIVDVDARGGRLGGLAGSTRLALERARACGARWRRRSHDRCRRHHEDRTGTAAGAPGKRLTRYTATRR